MGLENGPAWAWYVVAVLPLDSRAQVIIITYNYPLLVIIFWIGFNKTSDLRPCSLSLFLSWPRVVLNIQRANFNVISSRVAYSQIHFLSRCNLICFLEKKLLIAFILGSQSLIFYFFITVVPDCYDVTEGPSDSHPPHLRICKTSESSETLTRASCNIHDAFLQFSANHIPGASSHRRHLVSSIMG